MSTGQEWHLPLRRTSWTPKGALGPTVHHYEAASRLKLISNRSWTRSVCSRRVILLRSCATPVVCRARLAPRANPPIHPCPLTTPPNLSRSVRFKDEMFIVNKYLPLYLLLLLFVLAPTYNKDLFVK